MVDGGELGVDSRDEHVATMKSKGQRMFRVGEKCGSPCRYNCMIFSS